MTVSTRKVTLDVTKDDIEKGVPHSAESCPIALALRRTFPDAIDVAVSVIPQVTFKDSSCSMMATPKMSEFIHRFDRGNRFFRRARPFSEEITFTCRTSEAQSDDAEGDAELTH